MPATLLSFAPMIDSECSRLLLAHYGVDYVEKPHLFGWASVLSTLRGGTPQVPMLYGGGGPVCAGPRAISDYYETKCPEVLRLVPKNTMLAMQVNADWDRYNGILAGSTAAFAYFYLLPHREIMMEPIGRGVPKAEKAFLKTGYPAVAGLLKLLLRLNAANAADALTQIRVLFDETDRRVGDGRLHLAGATLTLGDFALATAAAPMLLPPGYTAPCPPLERMPAQMQTIIAELRQRPTAAFVARFFERALSAPVRETVQRGAIGGALSGRDGSLGATL